MTQINNIIDPNWLATLLSIVFAIYIFLLTIPILFFQTFLPEGIREIYNARNRNRGDLSRINRLAIWVVVFACILQNYSVNYLLDQIIG